MAVGGVEMMKDSKDSRIPIKRVTINSSNRSAKKLPPPILKTESEAETLLIRNGDVHAFRITQNTSKLFLHVLKAGCGKMC